MRKLLLVPAVLVMLQPSLVLANNPPSVEHQPAICTIPDKAVSLCAAVSDDGNVAAARLYFRKADEKYYNFVDMAFDGLDYCGTIPAPREGKISAIEYYIQAIDDSYEPTRTSTYLLPVEPEGTCEFPPLERNEARASAIRVFATSRKQGDKLDGNFERDGVTFVPAKK